MTENLIFSNFAVILYNTEMSDVLVIIPTYNEIENISAILEKVMKYPDNFDVLVIDDNSPDGTADAVRKVMEQFPGRVFLEEMDADFSHNPDDLTRLYHECKDKGADVCIGSRYVTGVNVVNWPMGRVLMSYFASAYVRFITGMKLHDSTAGFVCYRRRVLEAIKLDAIEFKGYAFQIEMKFKAHMKGFKIVELPIIFINRRLGTSKMNSSIFGEAVFGVIKLKLASIFSKKDF